MIRHLTLCTTLLQLSILSLVQTEKQHVQLSDSYLPVAMQVIAHLTDQMAYEVRDEQPTTKPTKPTVKPVTTKPTKPTVKPVTTKPTSKPFNDPTNRPAYVTYSNFPGSFKSNANGWSMGYKTFRIDMTTPHHKPGLYAPFAPPKPYERDLTKNHQKFVLLPLENNSQYTVIEPLKKRAEEPLLSIHNEEVKPLMEPSPEEAPLLPPHFDADKISSRSDALVLDDTLDDENLQYLSQNVREMIKLANDATDDRVVDVWEDLRAGPVTPQKSKMSSSNLRLLLLYDLLSREAKRQRLSDYSGFSPDVMKNLVDSSTGSARAQLQMALAKMLDRRDCEHDYANNRAREMVTELGKDESKLSSELRYLQPLVYVY